MTPTREQFDQWFAERYPDTTSVYGEFKSTPVRDLMREAHAAGREQGLREAAAKVRAILADCEARDVDDPELEQVAQDIEQMRACGSAATTI